MRDSVEEEKTSRPLEGLKRMREFQKKREEAEGE